MESKPHINEFGTEYWYNDNGELHREDGPSIIYADGSKRWFRNGEKHRDDGPAVEYIDGDKVWYINGTHVTEEEFNTYRLKKNLEELLNIAEPPSIDAIEYSSHTLKWVGGVIDINGNIWTEEEANKHILKKNLEELL